MSAAIAPKEGPTKTDKMKSSRGERRGPHTLRDNNKYVEQVKMAKSCTDACS